MYRNQLINRVIQVQAGFVETPNHISGSEETTSLRENFQSGGQSIHLSLDLINVVGKREGCNTKYWLRGLCAALGRGERRPTALL